MKQSEIQRTCDRRARANSTTTRQIQLSLISSDSFQGDRANVSMIDSDAKFTLNTQKMRNCEYRTDHEQFRYIVYKAIIYVRKDKERNTIDDGMMVEEINKHISISSNPIPLTQIGQKLLKNGYVLIAYCILMARLHKSQFYFKYLISMFDSSNDINQHFAEFKYYMNQPLQSFGVSGSKQKQYYEGERHSESLKRSNCHQIRGHAASISGKINSN